MMPLEASENALESFGDVRNVYFNVATILGRSTTFLDLNNVPSIQVGQCLCALPIAQNQLHVFFTKCHARRLGSAATIAICDSGLIVEGKMNTGFDHYLFEVFPLSLLAWLAAFVGIAFGAFKQACCHVRALIGQAACSANCSGRFAPPAFASLHQVFFLFFKGFKIPVSCVEIAPEARGTQIPNLIAIRITPGDNMIDALGVLLKTIGAILTIDDYHLHPGYATSVTPTSCFHGWQILKKETSPVCWVRGSAKIRKAKLAMQLTHRNTPNVSWQKDYTIGVRLSQLAGVLQV